MTTITGSRNNLEDVGPLVDAYLLPLQSGTNNDTPLAVRAVVDTGASQSAVKEGLAQSLGLVTLDMINLSTPTSSLIPCCVYAVRLMFDDSSQGVPLLVAEVPLPGQDVDFIIGRDVLRRGVFIYQGHINSFTLCL